MTEGEGSMAGRRDTDDDTARLEHALADVAADEIGDLLAEAQEAARDEVRAILQARWRDAYLRAATTGAVPEPEPEPPAGGDECAWWVFCVVAADDVALLPPGVETVIAGDLAAVVRPVPLSEFADDPLRAHLADAAWVERVSRAHEAMLDSLVPVVTIVPLRVCTVCLTRERVEALLGDRADSLAGALAALWGRSEWGVRVSASDRQQAPTDVVHQIHARLEREAVAAAVETARPPQDGIALLLDAAYLVEDGCCEALRRAVAALGAEHAPAGIVIELVGPRPPYAFTELSATALP